MSLDRETIRLASIYANPKLSRFDPLPRIIHFDDFDEGLCGWTQLVGNYEGSLDTILPGFRDFVPPMLSNSPMWDTGTAGAFDGNYAMKLATIPKAGAMSVGIKRITFRAAGLLQMETYFTFKPEATELQLSELDVRAFGFLFDLQDNRNRVMPHVRYVNAMNGKPVQKWQYKSHLETAHQIGDSGKTRSHFHLGPDGWTDLPGGEQKFCYNEIATKQNWHYLMVQFDLASMSFVKFVVNDHEFDASKMEPMRMPAWPNLWCMLNPCFFIETDVDKRAFLLIDSVLLSGEW